MVSSTVHFMLKNSDLCLYITHTILNLLKLGAKLKIFIPKSSWYLLQVHSIFHLKDTLIFISNTFMPVETPTQLNDSFTFLLLPFNFNDFKIVSATGYIRMCNQKYRRWVLSWYIIVKWKLIMYVTLSTV